MRYKTLTLLIIGMFLLTGAAYASDIPDFKIPSGLNEIGINSYGDGDGHNLVILEYNEETRSSWLENASDYLVEKYDGDDRYYIYADENGDCGVIEVVEVSGVKYIVVSWSPDGVDESEIIVNNLFDFNRLNNLEPVKV